MTIMTLDNNVKDNVGDGDKDDTLPQVPPVLNSLPQQTVLRLLGVKVKWKLTQCFVVENHDIFYQC